MPGIPHGIGPPARERATEIDLVDYLDIFRRRALLLTVMALLGGAAAFALSYLPGDRYQARAVIAPVREGASPSGLSVLVQQLEAVPGMSLSSPSSASEILALLNSNMLRKKAIDEHALLPVLFRDRWDAAANRWAGGPAPTAHDGLRAADMALSIRHSPKDNTITMTFESADADDAARFLERLLAALNAHLSGEARRLADSNRRYLEGQLMKTSDPLIRQNVYALIAQQIESSMMAGVMENFAFKVIDPPEPPDRKVPARRGLAAAAGLLGGLLSGAVAALALEFRDARRKMNGGRR